MPFRATPGTSHPTGYIETGITGAFTNAASVAITTTNNPFVWMRAV